MAVDVKKSIATIAAVAALSGGVIEGTKPVEPIDTVAVHEIVNLRTETAKVFQEADGKHRAVITTQPQHWRDEDGNYKAIDTTVQARAFLVKAFSAYDYETAFTGDTSALFKSGESPDYAIKTSGYSVAYTLLSDTTGVDIATETTTRGVKQTYTLLDEKAATTLRWLIETDAAMTREGDGFVFADNEGGFLWRLDPPKAWDAKGAVVSVAVSTAGDTLRWTVDTAKATYPVTVDPSTVIYQLAGGTGYMQAFSATNWLAARNSTTGNEMADTTRIKIDITSSVGESVYRVARGALSFNIGAGISSQIDSAKISLYESYYQQVDDSLKIALIASYQAKPVVAGSFNDFYGWTSSGAYDVVRYASDTNGSSLTPSAYNTITLNSTGIDSLKTYIGGTFKMMVLDANWDIPATAPGYISQMYINFNMIAIGEPPAYITIWYKVPYTPVPTAFTLSSPSTTGMTATWANHHTTGIDSLFLVTGAAAWVKHLEKTDQTTAITGLTPATQYIYKVAVDSTGTGTGYSNADTLNTLAEAPTSLALSEYDSTHVDISFSVGSNPAGTLFAVRDSTTQKWKDATGADTTTKTWRTLAQWQAVHLTVTKDTKVRLGVVGKNGDGVETAYVWGTVVTNNKKTFDVADISWLSKYGDDATYNTARDANIASDINDGGSYELGQQLSGGVYNVWRIAGEFVIPEADSITAAKLILTGSGDASTTNFDVQAFMGLWTAADATDLRYDKFRGRAYAGQPHSGVNLVSSWSTSSYAVGAWADTLTYTAAGVDSIETAIEDTLRITLVSSRDVGPNTPSGDEYVGFSDAKLRLTYYDYDYVPSGLSVTSLAPNRVIVSWTDNAATETGYYVVDGSTLAVMGGITNANAVADTIYVIPNTIYTFKVLVFGGKVDGEYSAASSAYCTDPGTLSAPVLTDLGGGLVKVQQDTSGSGNPADTDIASLFYTAAGDSYYVHNGALVSGVPHADSTNGWRTYDLWGASNGDTIQVEPGRTYTVKSIARTREY